MLHDWYYNSDNYSVTEILYGAFGYKYLICHLDPNVTVGLSHVKPLNM